MSDGELITLGEDFCDLNDVVYQLSCDEMRKRNLGDPHLPRWIRARSANRDDSTNQTIIDRPRLRKFVGKSVLCDCSDREEAWQISDVLGRAGIESWLESSQM